MISGKKADNSVLLQVRKWRQCSHFSWQKPNALFLDIVNMAMNFVPQKEARHHYTIDGTLCRFQIWTEVFCFQCNQLDLSQRLVDSGEKNSSCKMYVKIWRNWDQLKRKSHPVGWQELSRVLLAEVDYTEASDAFWLLFTGNSTLKQLCL